jgi:hypothetical protein
MPYSLHPYQYGYSNPVRYSDPTGSFVCAGVCVAVAVGGAIVLVAVAAESTRSTQMANDAYGSLPSFSFTGPQAENLARGWDYAISDGQRYAITPLADHGRPNMGQRAIDWLPPDPTAVVPNTFPPPMQERLPIYGFPLGTSGTDAVCTPGFDLEQPGIDDLYRLGPDLGVDPGLVPWVLMARSTRKLGDLQPLHTPGMNPEIERRLRSLTDQELLKTMQNDNDPIRVRPGRNVVIEGNTRVYEMQRRMQQDPNSIFHQDLDISVEVEPYQPLDPNLPPDY